MIQLPFLKFGLLKSLAGRVLNAAFLPSDFLLLRHRLLESLGRQPVLIYTMGKVGSTTVYHAFQQQFLFPLTYHVHHLTPDYFDPIVEKYKENGLSITDKASLRNLQKGSARHLSASSILRQVYNEESSKEWKIVTLVRDPFSTYISHLFQNPQISRRKLLDEKGDLDRGRVEHYVHDIFSRFDPEKDYISNWFDREFFKFTGVDLYRYPFDAQNGLSFVQSKKFKIAIISLETLNENLPEVIKEFVPGGKLPAVKKRNVRSSNRQGGLYKNLKKEIVVPREGLEKMYATKYAKHFFTDEFRKRMVAKWTGE